MKRSKRILIIILFALLLFVPFEVEASSWKFIWKNTTVHVPVGASIEYYKNYPQAYLYKDGVLLGDADITYNTEGDWLYYFKDVNTAKLGRYQVWYKAYNAKYSPGTCTGYKSLITFVVEDKESPYIKVLEPVMKIRRGDEYNLSANYTVRDNYKVESVTEVHSINTGVVGTYPVTVIARDSSGNQRKASFEAFVYENQAPVISSDIESGVLKIPVHEDYDIRSHFTAMDKFEGDITNKIIFPTLDTNMVSEYNYTVSVSNDAGLSDSITITIKVVDEEAPTLELTTHSILLDYTLDFSTVDFKKYIKSLTDNTSINYENLSITNDLENRVGNYTIWYSYTDGIYTVNDSIEVSLVSYNKPKIYVDDIELYVDSSINLYDVIELDDPSDPDIYDSLIIYDQNVNYNKEGIYYAEAYCMNSSGQSTTKSFKIIIHDTSLFKEENMPFYIVIFVSALIILILVLFILIYFLSKRRKKSL